MSIDFHSHLDLYPKPFEVAAECAKTNIYVLSVTTTPKAWVGTKKLEANSKRIWTALGFHPQLAHERAQELALFDSILPQVKYVGEIGLDGGRDFKNSWEAQLKVFRHILKSVNKAGGRIMSIHSRASAGAVTDEIRGISGIPILHWFTGSKVELLKAIDIGCWFSVGPAMLCSSKSFELVSLMPKERILTETDGPFASFNGKSLFPWDVEPVYRYLSEVWKMPLLEVKEQVLLNLKSLTSKM